jgi:hypothetical protein
MNIMNFLKYILSILIPGKSGREIEGSWMTVFELRQLLRPTNSDMPFGPCDSEYYYVSFEKWKDVFADCFSEIPKYMKNRRDCEDLAWIMRAMVLMLYGINGIGYVVGETEFGRHGFNIFISEKGVHLLEPNPKFAYGNYNILDVGERGYLPDLVLI